MPDATRSQPSNRGNTAKAGGGIRGCAPSVAGDVEGAILRGVHSTPAGRESLSSGARGESKVVEIVSPSMRSTTSLRWRRNLTTPPRLDAAQPLPTRVATVW
jgi:hypothetical protein